MKLRSEAFVVMTLLAMGGGVLAGLPAAERSPSQTSAVEDHSRDGWQLLVFETRNCGWCIKFRNELASEYEQSSYQAKAPLTYVQLDRRSPSPWELKRRVTATPTFVLVDSSGREVGRQLGYPGKGERLFTFVDRHL